MKKTISTLLIFLLSNFLFGQNPVIKNPGQTVYTDAALGYYVTKDKTVRSIWIIKNNPKERTRYIIIPDQAGHPNKILYPADISEYGFEHDGSKYYSAEVTIDGQTENIFLELLINDANTIIYVYPSEKKEYYFLQEGTDSPRLITDKDDLRNYFRNQASGCTHIETLDRYPMKLKRSSIKKMHEAYTHCNLNVFTRFRYGLTASVYLAKMRIGIDNEYKYNVRAVYSPGIFLEIPLDIRFSFRPEFSYMDYRTTGIPDRTIHKKVKMDYDRKSILIPLMFRYRVNQFNKKWIPYFELGPTIDIKVSGRNYNNVLNANLDVNPCQYGGALGTGVEYKLTDFISVYAGLRFNASTGPNKYDEKEMMNLYSFHLSVGF